MKPVAYAQLTRGGKVLCLTRYHADAVPLYTGRQVVTLLVLLTLVTLTAELFR